MSFWNWIVNNPAPVTDWIGGVGIASVSVTTAPGSIVVADASSFLASVAGVRSWEVISIAIASSGSGARVYAFCRKADRPTETAARAAYGAARQAARTAVQAGFAGFNDPDGIDWWDAGAGGARVWRTIYRGVPGDADDGEIGARITADLTAAATRRRGLREVVIGEAEVVTADLDGAARFSIHWGGRRA